MNEYQVILTVLRGLGLPKVDLLSKIDAYVKVQCGAFSAKTKTIDNCSEPVWNTDFVFPVPIGIDGRPQGVVSLQLFDSETLKDRMIGTSTLDLSKLHPNQLSYIELPIAFAREKYGKSGAVSRLVVAVRGWVASYGTLRSRLQALPGVLFNDLERRLYVPLPPSPSAPPGLLYLGVEYESDAVDFKVFVTAPQSNQYVDMAFSGRQQTKVRRRMYRSGHMVVPGLTAYEEIKLDDVPLDTDFRQLLVLCFDQQLLFSSNSDVIVSAHGWKGALGFHEASRSLRNVLVDNKEQEIFMGIEAGPGMASEAMLLVDYDHDDVDIKLAMLSSPTNLDKAWDLTITSGQEVKKTSQIYVPPKQCLGGQVSMSRVYELDDVAYGTAFQDIQLHKYQLSGMRQWDVASLVPLR